MAASGNKGPALARGIDVLQRVMQEESAQAFFNEPVREEDAPGYSEVVAHPVDLGTLHKQALSGELTSAEMLRKEVARVWLNCCRYNQHGTPVHDGALYLASQFDSLWHAEGLKGSTTPSEQTLNALAHGTPPEQIEPPATIRKRKNVSDHSTTHDHLAATDAAHCAHSGRAFSQRATVSRRSNRGTFHQRTDIDNLDDDDARILDKANGAEASDREARVAARLYISSPSQRQSSANQSTVRAATNELFQEERERPKLHSLHNRGARRAGSASIRVGRRTSAVPPATLASKQQPSQQLAKQQQAFKHAKASVPAETKQWQGDAYEDIAETNTKQEAQGEGEIASMKQQMAQEQNVDLEELARNASEPLSTTFTTDVVFPQGNKEMLSRAREIIDNFRQKPMAFWFRHPVDPKTAPGYEEVVKRPMDLSKIAQKIRKGRYKGPLGVLNDITQIWYNCFLFNNKGDSVWEAGVACQKEIMRMWREAGLPERPPERALQQRHQHQQQLQQQQLQLERREDEEAFSSNKHGLKKYKNWPELVRLAEIKEEHARALQQEAEDLEHAALLWERTNASNVHQIPTCTEEQSSDTNSMNIAPSATTDLQSVERKGGYVSNQQAQIQPVVMYDSFLLHQIAQPALQPLLAVNPDH